MKAHRWTVDLLVVAVATLAAAVAILVGGVAWRPLRIALALPVLLFWPGYAIVSAAFPEAADRGRELTLGGLERLVLSMTVSIAVVPIVAYVLNFTPFGIRLRPLLVAVTGVTVGFVLVAFARRARLSAEDRFEIRWGASLGAVGTYFTPRRDRLNPAGPFEARTDRQVLFNVLLVASVAVLLLSVGYAAVSSPDEDAQFTEFYLLAENETGDLVADHDTFPTEITGGETVHVAIENHEGETRTYTTVVLLQSVAADGDELQVQEEDELDRFETTVEPDETEITPYEIQPTMSGEEMRVTFLLYVGEAPDDPSIDDAYRAVYLRVSVG